MNTKAFRVITSIAMILILTVAFLSIIGIPVTGLYPGIAVLLVIALIPIASRQYAKQVLTKSIGFQKRYFRMLAVINLLSILVVLWMTFVIMVDRVLGKLLS